MADNRSGSDHWCYFGDGNAAQILDSREYIKPSSGKKYIKLNTHSNNYYKRSYEIHTRKTRSQSLFINSESKYAE